MFDELLPCPPSEVESDTPALLDPDEAAPPADDPADDPALEPADDAALVELDAPDDALEEAESESSRELRFSALAPFDPMLASDFSLPDEASTCTRDGIQLESGLVPSPSPWVTSITTPADANTAASDDATATARTRRR